MRMIPNRALENLFGLGITREPAVNERTLVLTRSHSFMECLFRRLWERVIDPITKFRCAIWDERGWSEEGVGNEGFVLTINESLNVYKRVFWGQIKLKPPIGLCGARFSDYFAPAF